ncbi:MAG: hypothetical protein QOH56_2841 [Pseudonocardiales bacterium]|nr:hypothetical protein [Pseudonocardiales bacterium]
MCEAAVVARQDDQASVAEAELIPLREAGRLVGKSPETIGRWAKAGVIDGYKIGPRTILVRRAQIISMIQQPMVPGGAR